MFYVSIRRSSFVGVVVVVVLLSIMASSVQAGWQEQVKLLAFDGETEDRFGFSVAISGNTIIVGAYMYGTSGLGGIGAAYLFDTTTGQQISKLTASDGDNHDQFGIGVAISGDTAIVGAYGDDDYTGSAYVFDVSDPYNPVQKWKLVASDRASPDMFGYTGIAIGDGFAIIGAHGHGDAGFMSGSVYVFDLTSGNQIAQFTASDAAPTAYFGISCAISGSTAIVGACKGNQGCPSCPIPPGVAYLFDISDPYHPVETSKLTAPDGQENDQFGFSVSIAGNAALVGARCHDGDGLTDCGAAYLFDVTDIHNPVLVRKLTASDSEAYGYFGHSVAMSADTAIVSAGWEDNEGLVDCGSAYLFDVTTGEQLGKLAASDGEDYDQFGYSVAIEGKTLVVGTNLDDDSGSNSGSAYVFVNRQPPIANAGLDQTVEQESYAGREVTLDGSGSTDEDSTPGTNDDIVSFNWYEGETLLGSGQIINYTFPLGSHTVKLVVTDSFGESDEDEVAIIVQDTTPPIVQNVSATPNVLWPVNHKMVAVAVAVDARDICDRAPKSRIVNVTSNEPINGPGDGNTEPDWEITGALTLKLRAERSGTGNSRIYTIYIECRDVSGNTTTATVDVTVPHDKR